MPLADEILVWAGLDVPSNLRLPSDAQITTSCPTCGEKQSLSEAAIIDEGDELIYACKIGCGPMLVIGPPNDEPWPGRGYRMGDWVLRNATDLTFRLIDQSGKPSGQPVFFPASSHALD